MSPRNKLVIAFLLILGMIVLLGALAWDQEWFSDNDDDSNTIDSILLVYNGTILTINESNEVIENGVLVIEKDRIIDIGNSSLLKQYNTKQRIDARGGLILPGMINCHNHLPMIAFRSLGEEGVEDRLFSYFFPLENDLLSRSLIYHATRFGAVELALGGVTTFVDMYYHVDEMARAVKEVGIRGVLGETVISFPVVDAPEPYGGLEYAMNFISEYQNDPLITPAFAPHSVYTVEKEIIQRVHELSVETESPVLMHVSEKHDETVLSENPKNLSSVAFLHDIGALDHRMVLAHAIFVSEEDLDLIKTADAGISYNAMANAKGGTGIAPAKEMNEKGLRVGLGTDGPMSSNQVDLWRTLAFTANMQRIRYENRLLFPPDLVVRMATFGGAQAIHREKDLGSLEVGKKADIIIVETESVNMIPNYDPFAVLVYQTSPQNVVTTIVNGVVVVKDREVQTVDMREVRKEMNEIEIEVLEYAKENLWERSMRKKGMRH